MFTFNKDQQTQTPTDNQITPPTINEYVFGHSFVKAFSNGIGNVLLGSFAPQKISFTFMQAAKSGLLGSFLLTPISFYVQTQTTMWRQKHNNLADESYGQPLENFRFNFIDTIDVGAASVVGTKLFNPGIGVKPLLWSGAAGMLGVLFMQSWVNSVDMVLESQEKANLPNKRKPKY